MKLQNIIALLLLMAVSGLQAQKKQTITYFKNDTLSLQLNLFLPEKASAKKLPLVLYVHGGGFSGGDRSAGDSPSKFLAQNGYAAATLSYTLYAKNKKYSCDGALPEKIKAFQHAVNDLWLATSFFIDNQEKYNIDTSKIFITGVSAGGETVLHAAFWDFKLMNMYSNTLPENFRYAGLISGAGAIMDLNLITAENKIPMMLFHGNGDQTVPYGTAAHHYCPTNATGWLMLFGSYSIYNDLIAKDGTVSLYTFCGGGHEYSGYLFEKDQKPMLDFLNDVMAGEKFQNHTIIPTGKKNALSAAYHFCD